MAGLPAAQILNRKVVRLVVYKPVVSRTEQDEILVLVSQFGGKIGVGPRPSVTAGDDVSDVTHGRRTVVRRRFDDAISGGSVIPVLSERGGVMTLLERPVVITEKTPVVGTVGDIMLCDFSKYLIGMRADIALKLSEHVYFGSDEIAVRLRIRIDGRPMHDAVITPANGDTLSPFVALATRA